MKRIKSLDGIALVIPVLNEEKTLNTIIERCSKQKVITELVIVNDGSTDRTKKILNSLKLKRSTDKPLLTIIHHPKNMGKGAAIKTGINNASGKFIMVQDADLEYYPEEISRLYEKAINIKDGIVFGSRTRGKNKGYLLAQVGNWYLNTMFNFLFGLNLTDSYTCYKLMPARIWKNLKLKSDGFEIDSELVAKLGSKGYKIVEEQISYNPRKYSEGKKINWIDLLKATIIALKVRLS